MHAANISAPIVAFLDSLPLNGMRDKIGADTAATASIDSIFVAKGSGLGARVARVARVAKLLKGGGGRR